MPVLGTVPSQNAQECSARQYYTILGMKSGRSKHSQLLRQRLANVADGAAHD